MPVLPTHPQPSLPLQPLPVPDVMGQTGLVQVILNHGQFTQSLQTRAFKGEVRGGDGQSQAKGLVLNVTTQSQGPCGSSTLGIRVLTKVQNV